MLFRITRRLKQSGAFTLTELLIAIGIIAVLLGILSAVVVNGTTRSRTTQCAGMLRQIGAALAAYTSDHNGLLISGAVPKPEWFWYNELDPYMAAGSSPSEKPPLWARCPAKKFQTLTNETAGYGWNYLNFGWDLTRKNSWGFNSRILQVSKPSTTIIIGDSKDVEINPKDLFQNRYLYPPDDKIELLPRRHQNRGNYLFLDGHVEALTPEELLLNKHLYKKVQN